MRSTLNVLAPTEQDTRGVGAAIAEALGPGDIVALTGELGAGKTTFVQGAARALGVTDPVASPTFVLMRQYRGNLSVAHVDVYRLNRIQEVLDLGFEELLDEGWVVFVEWGDVIDALFSGSYLEVELTVGPDESRSVRVTGHGPAWTGRWERLEALLGGWRAA
jgi:tRNA threonylcarbamoyladenosine biosynthesis protein TsaE